MFNFLPTSSTSKNSQKRASKQQKEFGYESLEPRKVLATTFGFDGGTFTVQLDSPLDRAEIDANSGLEVNGEEVLDANNNQVDGESVENIIIRGTGLDRQQVILDGYFDYGTLDNVTIEDVSVVIIDGELELNGDLTIDASRTDSFLFQREGSRLLVNGKTDITFPDRAILLQQPENDFVGEFSATGFSVLVNDINGMHFGKVNVDHTLEVTAPGDITQSNTKQVKSGHLAKFNSQADILLPNSNNDFRGLELESLLGEVEIGDANSIELGEIRVGQSFTVNAQAHVRHLFQDEYTFSGNFEDSDLNGPPLTPIDGTLTGSRFEFGEQEGLSVQLLEEDFYYVEFEYTRGALNDTYKKLIDFEDRSSDNGLYLYQDVLRFFGANSRGTTPILEGETHLIGFQRFDDEVTVYLDGKAEFSFDDSNGLAIAESGLHMFVDDFSTFNNEGSVGSVDNLRVSYFGINVGGDLNISTGGNILLNGPSNIVSGFISMEGNDIKINGGLDDVPNNQGDLKFRNIDAARNVQINALGDILQGGGTIDVGGNTELFATQTIRFANMANNFIGKVSAAGESVTLADKNQIMLDQIDAGTLRIEAVGTISNSNFANIATSGVAHLTANRITLGSANNDSIELAVHQLETTGRSEIHQDGTIRIKGVEAGSLILTSTADIRDNADAIISVTGNAKFIAAASINLGDTENDSLTMASSTLQSGLDIILSVNGDLNFTGNTFARFIFVRADGNILDFANSKMRADIRADFEAGGNVFIGDHANDLFNARALSFRSGGTAGITENSDIILAEFSSAVDNVVLRTEGRILDAQNSNLFAGRSLVLGADKVLLGDGAATQLSMGSVRLQNIDNVTLIANSGITFNGNSTANNAAFFSASPFGFTNDAGAKVNIAGTLEMHGQVIDLGSQPSDEITMSRLIFGAQGSVSIEADSDIILAKTNVADSLRLVSTTSIRDVRNSSLTVNGQARFAAPLVVIGDTATDTFNAGSVSFFSTGFVGISEDSSTRISGQNQARFLRLTSVDDITDNANAETIVTERAVFFGVDLIIGELEDDCFDVLAGIDGLVTNGTGTVDVRLGC